MIENPKIIVEAKTTLEQGNHFLCRLNKKNFVIKIKPYLCISNGKLCSYFFINIRKHIATHFADVN